GHSKAIGDIDCPRQVEWLTNDDHRRDLKDIPSPVHAAVGIEPGMIQEDIIGWNACLKEISPHRIYLIVGEAFIVSRYHYLRHLMGLIELESLIRAFFKDRREISIFQDRCSEHQGCFGGWHIGGLIKHQRLGIFVEKERDACNKEKPRCYETADDPGNMTHH